MSNAANALVLAAAAQAFLTMIAFGFLGLARARAFRAGLDPQATASDLGVYPEAARVAAAHVTNQFETPVLFFAAVAVALAAGMESAGLALLAWAWLATRAAHMAIHLGPNVVRWRALAFALGVGLLVVMWIWIAGGVVLG